MKRVLLKYTLILTVGFFLFIAQQSVADNWSTWRGPHANGVCDESNIANTWSKTKNVLWRLELPGQAGSTPIIWEDKIFLTTVGNNNEDLLLMCIGTDGTVRWEKKLGTGNRDVRRGEGNSASPSPCTDGQHVWAYFSTGDIGCYDFDGNQIWKGNLEKWYGEFNMYFVMASSPIVDGDRLYLQLIHSNIRNKDDKTAGLVLALDKLSGKEIWAHERQSDAHSECEHSYASPFLYRDNEQEFLLSHGADYVSAHSLSDGSEIWRCGGLNLKDRYNPSLRFVASPAAVPGLIVVPSAKNGPVLGLNPNAKGNITDTDEGHIWRRDDNTPDVPSPLIHDGLVYLCRENGVLICIDAQTGEEIYQQRTHNNRHRASPVYADGKVYLTSRDGLVTVVKAGRKFEILAQNDINETIASSPAISNGAIYLRSYQALYSIRNSQ